ncbi:hypothetical protein BYT27DRAFT_7208361 [Phlegmacium glaucopus]|nr:hypothetical protein BYT27DRAFT_7208361 [Phlegmacium glaucopus]
MPVASRGHPKDELNDQMCITHQQISIFPKSDEFRLWLKEEKGNYIDSLSGEQGGRHGTEGNFHTYYDDVNSASIPATNNTAYKWSFATKIRIATPLEDSVKPIGAAIDNNVSGSRKSVTTLWFLFLRLQESLEDWRLGGVGSVASVEEVKGVTSVVVKNNSVSLAGNMLLVPPYFRLCQTERPSESHPLVDVRHLRQFCFLRDINEFGGRRHRRYQAVGNFIRARWKVYQLSLSPTRWAVSNHNQKILQSLLPKYRYILHEQPEKKNFRDLPFKESMNIIICIYGPSGKCFGLEYHTTAYP